MTAVARESGTKRGAIGFNEGSLFKRTLLHVGTFVLGSVAFIGLVSFVLVSIAKAFVAPTSRRASPHARRARPRRRARLRRRRTPRTPTAPRVKAAPAGDSSDRAPAAVVEPCEALAAARSATATLRDATPRLTRAARDGRRRRARDRGTGDDLRTLETEPTTRDDAERGASKALGDVRGSARYGSSRRWPSPSIRAGRADAQPATRGSASVLRTPAARRAATTGSGHDRRATSSADHAGASAAAAPPPGGTTPKPTAAGADAGSRPIRRRRPTIRWPRPA